MSSWLVPRVKTYVTCQIPPILRTAVFALMGFIGAASSASRVVGAALGAGEPAATVAGNSTETVDPILRQIVEAPRISQCAISPNGRHLLYAVSRPSVADNQIVTELLLQDVSGGTTFGAPRMLQRAVDQRKNYNFNAAWCPDSKCVTFRAVSPVAAKAAPAPLLRYDLATRLTAAIPIEDTDAASSRLSRPRITSIGADYRWSKSGAAIAFTAPVGKVERLSPRGGLPVANAILHNGLSFNLRPNNGLFVLDPATGRLRQISPETMDVEWFDWSPDERAFAIAAVEKREPRNAPESTDLFIIDRATGAIRTLLRQPGSDGHPIWSPDGRWIGFGSKFGETEGPSELAVMPSAGGPVVRFSSADPSDHSASVRMAWSWAADSSGFYYANDFHMTTRLCRTDVATGRVMPFPIEEGVWIESLSVSADGRWLLFARSTANSPTELFLRALPNGNAVQVTRLSPGVSLRSQFQVEVRKWASRDGVTIHGLLFRPIQSGRAAAAPPLPTILHVRGGPHMVSAGFATNGLTPELPLFATKGYAVLIPNTRGRQGYGRKLQDGMRDGASYGRLPLEDALSGLDQLVQQGIADPARLGISGLSYGGYLTSYAVTRTNRFRAAINQEGVASTFISHTMPVLPGTNRDRAYIRGFGIQNPFALSERPRLIEESPAFNAHCISTPMLLLYGERSELRQSDGAVMFSALQRFGIPVEFVLYDEGHGFASPMAQVDYAQRSLAWFDYWVRGLPYRDAALGKKYDTWRTQRPTAGGDPSECPSRLGSR